MIRGIGIDIVEVSEVESSISKYGERYLERVFTQQEVEYCRSGTNSGQRYAARIAAKEAAMKAMGTGWDRGVEWLSFEVVNEASGRPSLRMHGAAATLAAENRITRSWVSLAHNAGYAIAEVVCESDG
jgi:holo-[acyl-carrier protein] synthase